jgi:hypothetical protein
MVPLLYNRLAISADTQWNRLALQPLQGKEARMSKDQTFGTPKPGAPKGTKKKAAGKTTARKRTAAKKK